MTTPTYLLTPTTLTVFANNTVYSMFSDSPQWPQALQAIRDQDWDRVIDLASPKVRLTRYIDNAPDFRLLDNEIQYQGQALPQALSTKLFAMMDENIDIQPLVAFIRNLELNPSKRAVDELYGFLEFGNLPITPDGHFLAYKRVRSDFRDVYSGQFDNSIGQVVEMPRNRVNDNKDQTCSAGLHFCSLNYLKSFSGDKLVALKINPRDVVSIPSDYHNTKGRCCRYEVVAELDIALVGGARNEWNSSVFDYDDPDRYTQPDEDDDDRKYMIVSTLKDGSRRFWAGYGWTSDETFAQQFGYLDGDDSADEKRDELEAAADDQYQVNYTVEIVRPELVF